MNLKHIEEEIVSLLTRIGTKPGFAQEIASLVIYQFHTETATRADILDLRQEVKLIREKLDEIAHALDYTR